MANSDHTTDVGRFYTRSRRFPKLIGRLHDGTRIPGGPYTVAQAILGAVAFGVANLTRSAWGTGSILLDLPITIGIAWGIAWVAGRIPATRRNLLSVISGAIRAYTRPIDGAYRGRTFRARRASYAEGTAAISATNGLAATAAHSAQPAPQVAVAPAEPAARALPAGKKPMTAVERLLEQARNQ